MLTLNPYITFDGNCKTAFEFYQTVFEKPVQIFYFKDMPPSDDIPPMPAEMLEKVMHASIALSDTVTLMGSDTNRMMSELKQGNHIQISINTDNADEATRLFNALSKQGQVTMPLGETFFASLFGMVIDQFGIQWMVNFGNK